MIKRVKHIYRNIIVLAALAITACADPYVPKTLDKHLTHKDCEGLQQELSQLQSDIERYENDGWLHPSYVLVVPAMVSKMRYNDAIEGAQKRIGYTESVMQIKGCFLPPEQRDAYIKQRYGVSSSVAQRGAYVKDSTVNISDAHSFGAYTMENQFLPTRAYPVLLHEAE